MFDNLLIITTHKKEKFIIYEALNKVENIILKEKIIKNEEEKMIRNLIFDLDNTLIFDKASDSEYYKKVLLDLGYDENKYYEIYVAIDEYDKSLTEENSFYNEKEMLKFINEYVKENYPIELIVGLRNAIEENWIKRPLIKTTVLENLSKKYNLYVYTNYFASSQIKRLEKVGYNKYFKKVFGADEYGVKPYKKNFERVLNEIAAKPEECIMIGDTKQIDIAAANNIGMKSILFDFDGKRDNKVDAQNYIVIRDMNDLEKVL